MWAYRTRCGAMEIYDKSYDRVTTKNERRLKRINRIFHKVTTTDDPIIRQVSMNVYKCQKRFVLNLGIIIPPSAPKLLHTHC